MKCWLRTHISGGGGRGEETKYFLGRIQFLGRGGGGWSRIGGIQNPFLWRGQLLLIFPYPCLVVKVILLASTLCKIFRISSQPHSDHFWAWSSSFVALFPSPFLLAWSSLFPLHGFLRGCYKVRSPFISDNCTIQIWNTILQYLKRKKNQLIKCIHNHHFGLTREGM